MQAKVAHLAMLKPGNNFFVQKPQHTMPAEFITDIMNRDADELIQGSEIRWLPRD